MRRISTNSRTRKRVLVFALMLWCTGRSQLKAQDGWCGTPSPTPEDVQEVVDLLKQWNDEGGQLPGTPITIPVAFHIVRIDE
jgi:hypothetical protein